MKRFLIGDKTVHRKAVLILIGVLAVAGIGVHFLHAYQCKRNAHGLYHQALQMEKEGRLAEGASRLEQYLGLVPTDTDALAKLGFWLVRDAKTDRVRLRAMMVLDQVLRRNAARSDVRREVAGLAVRLRHFTDARDHLAVLMRDSPEDPELMHLSGRCEIAAKQYQKGAEWYSKAFKLAPAHGELALDYAALLRERMGAQDLADDVIERSVRAAPQELPVRLGAANYYLRSGDLVQADKHIQFALNDLSSSSQELLLLAADVALARGKVDDSRGHLERAAKLYPGDTGVNRKLARVELAEGKMQAALARIEQQLRSLSDNPAELWDLAEFSLLPEMQFFLAQQYEADGNWRLAKLQFMRVLAAQEKNPNILWRYAHGLLRQGEAAEARAIVDRLAAVMPDTWETAELKARVHHAQSQKDQARDVLLNYADRPKARQDFAALVLDELGHAAEAEKLFQRHADTSKNPAATLLLARHLAKHGRCAEALSLCEKAWSTCPPEMVAQCCTSILSAASATADQRALVAGWFARAIKTNPKNLALQALLAEVHIAPGKDAEACTIYRGILQQDRDNIYSLNNLAFLQALKQENLAECLEMIDRAIAVAGPHPSLLDSRAVIHLQKGEHWLAVEDLNQALTQRRSPTDYFHLAQAHFQAKNRPAATDALKKAMELGLQVQQLHALEHSAFHKLTKELE